MSRNILAVKVRTLSQLQNFCLDSSSKYVTSSKQNLYLSLFERRKKKGGGAGGNALAKRAPGLFFGNVKPVGPVPPKNHPVSEPLRDGVKSPMGLRAGEGSWETRLTVSASWGYCPSFSSENRQSD